MASEPAAEAPRSPQYSFAHKVLPIIALGNPRRMYRQLVRDQTAYVNKLWREWLARSGTTGDSTDLALDHSSFGQLEVFVLTMPPPHNALDALHIGMAFTTELSFWWKRVQGVQYFTLEKGVVSQPTGEAYCFCEWAGQLPFPKHHNLGWVRWSNIGEFIQRVRSTVQPMYTITTRATTIYVCNEHGEVLGGLDVSGAQSKILIGERGDPAATLLVTIMSSFDNLTRAQRQPIEQWARSNGSGLGPREHFGVGVLLHHLGRRLHGHRIPKPMKNLLAQLVSLNQLPLLSPIPRDVERTLVTLYG